MHNAQLQMSQIVSKRNILEIDNPQIQPASGNINQRVVFLLFMDQTNIALVQSYAISIVSTKSNQVVQRIELEFEVCKIVFSRRYRQFIILPKCQDLSFCSIITISLRQSPVFNSYYKYQENKIGNKQFEWQSWLKIFQESERVVLVRKFYGYSLCCVFEQSPHLVKCSQFKINEECISKLDQERYMVNFRQFVTKYSIFLEIVNVQTNKKSQYRINEQIVPNTTKSVKLWRRQKQLNSLKGQNICLTLLIAMNTKFQGYSLMIAKFLQQSNIYSILGVVSQPKYEIYKLLTPQNQELMTLQYRYDEVNRRVDFVLCNYQLDQNGNLFNQTSHKTIQPSFVDIAYYHPNQTLLFYQNVYEYGADMQSSSHFLHLNAYKKVEKNVIYASLLDKIDCGKSISQQVLDLLL